MEAIGGVQEQTWAPVPLHSTDTPTQLNAVSMGNFVVCFFHLTSNYGPNFSSCSMLKELRAKCAIKMLYKVMNPMTAPCFYFALTSGSQ